MIFTKKIKLILIIFHILLAYIAVNYTEVFRLYYVAIFLYSIYHISKKEKSGQRISNYYIAYFVGLEVLIKLSRTVIIDQFGKYTVIMLILLSFVRTKSFDRLNPKVFLLFLGLMSASVVLVDTGTFARNIDLISFYLSGPFCLALCVFYFNNYSFEFNKDFINTLFLSLLPIISIAVFCVLKSGAIDIVDLQYGANASQSGGYAPNQVAVILGYGIVVLFIGFIFKKSITGNFIYDALVLILLVYRILLTFSRGGFLVALLAVVLSVVYVSIKSKSFVGSNKFALFSIVIGFILVLFVWNRANEATGNKLEERYEGFTGDTQFTDRKEFTSGRDILVEVEWEIFKDHWIMGVGPGMSTIYRSEKLGREDPVANHTEFTRMLAEHGLYGVLALIIILGYPVSMLLKSKNINNSFIIVLFVSLSLLTLAHNAHRIALPSFLYGLAFVNIIKDKKDSESEEVLKVGSKQGKKRKSGMVMGILMKKR